MAGFGVVAVAAILVLFGAGANKAEAAIVSVAITIVLTSVLDRVNSFVILNTQFELVNPPRAYFIVGAGFLLSKLV